MKLDVEGHLEALSKDKQEMKRGLSCIHGNRKKGYLKAGISGIQRKIHSSCRGLGRVGINNEPLGMWFRQKDESVVDLFCLSPRKKVERRRPWGRTEQATVRRGLGF